MHKAPLVILSGLFAFLIPAAGVSSTESFPGGNGTILARGYSLDDPYALRVVSLDGGRPRLIPHARTHEGAAWSPDGTRLAFARLRGGGISILDAAGRHRKQLTTRGIQPAWSPDGSRLVFTQLGYLYVIGRDGRMLRRLFRGSNAVWSPDGKRLAFESGRSDIFVAALNGSDRLRLTSASGYDCGGGLPGDAGYFDPSWAPDGSRIAYELLSICGSEGMEEAASSSIDAVSPDRARRWRLVDGQRRPGGPAAPVWSPDGLYLAYSDFYSDAPGDGGLKVLPLGGTPRRISQTMSPLDWRPVCDLRGGPENDDINGTAASELFCGLGGDDTISGAAGSDRLFGESGDDRFIARDGEFDVIGCGAGRDRVLADRIDLVGWDCEVVSRSWGARRASP